MMGSLSHTPVCTAGLAAAFAVAAAVAPLSAAEAVLGFLAKGSVLCLRPLSLSALRLPLPGLTSAWLSTPASAAGRFLCAFSLPLLDSAAALLSSSHNSMCNAGKVPSSAALAEATALPNPHSLDDAHSRTSCDHLLVRTVRSKVALEDIRGCILGGQADGHLIWSCGEGPCRCRRCRGAWACAWGLLHAGPLQ